MKYEDAIRDLFQVGPKWYAFIEAEGQTWRGYDEEFGTTADIEYTVSVAHSDDYSLSRESRAEKKFDSIESLLEALIP